MENKTRSEYLVGYRNELDILRKELKDNGKKVPYEINDLFFSYMQLLEENPEMKPSGLENIMSQFINGFPLSPIYDTEEEWMHIEEEVGLPVHIDYYQSHRRASLFKMVTRDPDGNETSNFSDFGAVIFIDVDSSSRISDDEVKRRYLFLYDLVDSMDPIQFPYLPTKKVKVFVSFTMDGEEELIYIPYMINRVGVLASVDAYFSLKKGHGWEKCTKERFWNVRGKNEVHNEKKE